MKRLAVDVSARRLAHLAPEPTQPDQARDDHQPADEAFEIFSDEPVHVCLRVRREKMETKECRRVFARRNSIDQQL